MEHVIIIIFLHHTGCSIQAVYTVYSTAEDQPFTTATEGW